MAAAIKFFGNIQVSKNNETERGCMDQGGGEGGGENLNARAYVCESEGMRRREALNPHNKT